MAAHYLPLPKYGTYTLADDVASQRLPATAAAASTSAASGGTLVSSEEDQLKQWLAQFNERMAKKRADAEAADDRRREAAARETEYWAAVHKDAAAAELNARRLAEEEERLSATRAAAAVARKTEEDEICRDMTTEEREAWLRDQAELDALEGRMTHHLHRLERYATYAEEEYAVYLARRAAEESARQAELREQALREELVHQLQNFQLWVLECDAILARRSVEEAEEISFLPFYALAAADHQTSKAAARSRCYASLSDADRAAVDAISDERREEVLDDLVEMASLKAASKRARHHRVSVS